MKQLMQPSNNSTHFTNIKQRFIIVNYSLRFKTLYNISIRSDQPSLTSPTMNKIQLTQQSLMKQSQHHNEQISNSININAKKSRDRDQANSKENQSKHMNAIKPYVNHVKQRKISKRDSQKNIPSGSPYLPQSNNVSGIGNPCENNSKPKNKKGQTSSKRLQQSLNSKNIGDLYSELVAIKAQYKTLKNSYNGLLKQNNQLTQRGERQAANATQLRKQMERLKRQQDKNKNNVRFMEQQIQRIKKECVRMVEAEKFKNKKLQETLQQKQLMIAYLRNQLAILNGQSNPINSSFFFQHTAPTYLRSAQNNIEGLCNNPNSEGNRYLHSKKDPQFYLNKNAMSMLPSPINPPLSQPLYHNNVYNPSQINKSVINQSAISSIPNHSMIAVSQLIDLPRQMNYQKNRKREVEENKFLLNSDIKNIQQVDRSIDSSNRNKVISHKNKREYIFSNEDDSLSFSYEKSKQSISHHQYDSIQSLNDPTILTFTKKDVYVLDEDEQSAIDPNNNGKEKNNNESLQNQEMEQNKSSIIIMNKGEKSRIFNKNMESKHQSNLEIDNISSSAYNHYENYSQQDVHEKKVLDNEGGSNYTGQEELMTFENRGDEKNIHESLFKIINPHIKNKKQYKQMRNKNKIKDKISYSKHNTDDEKKQISSKSKLHTKRLHINIDQMGGLEGKEESVQTKKKGIQKPDTTNPKTGKKKLSRKRKSQQCGGSLSKK